MNVIDIAKNVLDIESRAISELKNFLDENFESIVNLIFKSTGRLVVCGMGKSGIIGKKIAATLASTGTSSFFLHPGEAYHGDLGMIGKDDILLLLSNSGETDEVLKLIPFLKYNGNLIVSMTGNSKSTLAINSTFHINIFVEEEACPLQLAPTSSTTATLAMGDALAVALMKLRDFKDKDFAQFHPGGSLGKRLLTTIKTVMKKDKLPICNETTSIKDIIHIMTQGQYGLVVVMNKDTICGIITDYDLRQVMERYEKTFFNLKAVDIMNKTPKTINENEKISQASEIMKKNKINTLLVVDDKNNLSGVVHLRDFEI